MASAGRTTAQVAEEGVGMANSRDIVGSSAWIFAEREKLISSAGSFVSQHSVRCDPRLAISVPSVFSAIYELLISVTFFLRTLVMSASLLILKHVVAVVSPWEAAQQARVEGSRKERSLTAGLGGAHIGTRRKIRETPWSRGEEEEDEDEEGEDTWEEEQDAGGGSSSGLKKKPMTMKKSASAVLRSSKAGSVLPRNPPRAFGSWRLQVPDHIRLLRESLNTRPGPRPEGSASLRSAAAAPAAEGGIREGRRKGGRGADEHGAHGHGHEHPPQLRQTTGRLVYKRRGARASQAGGSPSGPASSSGTATGDANVVACGGGTAVEDKSLLTAEMGLGEPDVNMESENVLTPSEGEEDSMRRPGRGRREEEEDVEVDFMPEGFDEGDTESEGVPGPLESLTDSAGAPGGPKKKHQNFGGGGGGGGGEGGDKWDLLVDNRLFTEKYEEDFEPISLLPPPPPPTLPAGTTRFPRAGGSLVIRKRPPKEPLQQQQQQQVQEGGAGFEGEGSTSLLFTQMEGEGTGAAAANLLLPESQLLIATNSEQLPASSTDIVEGVKVDDVLVGNLSAEDLLIMRQQQAEEAMYHADANGGGVGVASLEDGASCSPIANESDGPVGMVAREVDLGAVAHLIGELVDGEGAGIAAAAAVASDDGCENVDVDVFVASAINAEQVEGSSKDHTPLSEEIVPAHLTIPEHGDGGECDALQQHDGPDSEEKVSKAKVVVSTEEKEDEVPAIAASDSDLSLSESLKGNVDLTIVTGLRKELEIERTAAARAAEEAMRMIMNLQKEKAALVMEMKRLAREAEEREAYDETTLSHLKADVHKKLKTNRMLDNKIHSFEERLTGAKKVTPGASKHHATGNKYRSSRTAGNGSRFSATGSEMEEEEEEEEEETTVPSAGDEDWSQNDEALSLEDMASSLHSADVESLRSLGSSLVAVVKKKGAPSPSKFGGLGAAPRKAARSGRRGEKKSETRRSTLRRRGAVEEDDGDEEEEVDTDEESGLEEKSDLPVDEEEKTSREDLYSEDLVDDEFNEDFPYDGEEFDDGSFDDYDEEEVEGEEEGSGGGGGGGGGSNYSKTLERGEKDADLNKSKGVDDERKDGIEAVKGKKGKIVKPKEDGEEEEEGEEGEEGEEEEEDSDAGGKPMEKYAKHVKPGSRKEGVVEGQSRLVPAMREKVVGRKQGDKEEMGSESEAMSTADTFDALSQANASVGMGELMDSEDDDAVMVASDGKTGAPSFFSRKSGKSMFRPKRSRRAKNEEEEEDVSDRSAGSGRLSGITGGTTGSVRSIPWGKLQNKAPKPSPELRGQTRDGKLNEDSVKDDRSSYSAGGYGSNRDHRRGGGNFSEDSRVRDLGGGGMFSEEDSAGRSPKGGGGGEGGRLLRKKSFGWKKAYDEDLTQDMGGGSSGPGENPTLRHCRSLHDGMAMSDKETVFPAKLGLSLSRKSSSRKADDASTNCGDDFDDRVTFFTSMGDSSQHEDSGHDQTFSEGEREKGGGLVLPEETTKNGQSGNGCGVGAGVLCLAGAKVPRSLPSATSDVDHHEESDLISDDVDHDWGKSDSGQHASGKRRMGYHHDHNRLYPLEESDDVLMTEDAYYLPRPRKGNMLSAGATEEEEDAYALLGESEDVEELGMHGGRKLGGFLRGRGGCTDHESEEGSSYSTAAWKYPPSSPYSKLSYKGRKPNPYPSDEEADDHHPRGGSDGDSEGGHVLSEDLTASGESEPEEHHHGLDESKGAAPEDQHADVPQPAIAAAAAVEPPVAVDACHAEEQVAA